MKRMLSFLLLIVMMGGALSANAQNKAEKVTTKTVYDAADSVGEVVNTSAPENAGVL